MYPSPPHADMVAISGKDKTPNAQDLGWNRCIGRQVRRGITVPVAIKAAVEPQRRFLEVTEPICSISILKNVKGS
jgi:hypothetical protein